MQKTKIKFNGKIYYNLDDAMKDNYPELYKHMVESERLTTYRQIGIKYGFNYSQKPYEQLIFAEAFLEYIKENEYKHTLWML